MQHPQYRTVYLAGAIRDGRYEDIRWREEAIDRLGGKFTILNPLGNKSWNPRTHEWRIGGIRTSARHIVKQDFFCVDRADVIIANLLSMSDGYQSIGTMMELGRATVRGSLIYAIIAESFRGHMNPEVFQLHPFLEQTVAEAFPDVETCLTFLEEHAEMLNGENPRFGGSA